MWLWIFWSLITIDLVSPIVLYWISPQCETLSFHIDWHKTNCLRTNILSLFPVQLTVFLRPVQATLCGWSPAGRWSASIWALPQWLQSLSRCPWGGTSAGGADTPAGGAAWPRCGWYMAFLFQICCFFSRSLSRSIQVGLLAARRRAGRVPFRGPDQPGRHLLPGLHHPAALHDPRGAAGRLHCQGQRWSELRGRSLASSANILTLCMCVCVLAQYAEDIKHKTTLLELQKMFTYLMVGFNSRHWASSTAWEREKIMTLAVNLFYVF